MFQAEIERVMSLGVTADRIIYANPCKQVSFVRYAARNNVRLMTFDNIPELYKVRSKLSLSTVSGVFPVSDLFPVSAIDPISMTYPSPVSDVSISCQ